MKTSSEIENANCHRRDCRINWLGWFRGLAAVCIQKIFVSNIKIEGGTLAHARHRLGVFAIVAYLFTPSLSVGQEIGPTVVVMLTPYSQGLTAADGDAFFQVSGGFSSVSYDCKLNGLP